MEREEKKERKEEEEEKKEEKEKKKEAKEKEEDEKEEEEEEVTAMKRDGSLKMDILMMTDIILNAIMMSMGLTSEGTTVMLGNGSCWIIIIPMEKILIKMVVVILPRWYLLSFFVLFSICFFF
jgi:uncharacterized membrane protein YdbT with pleckstrin-like domain